MLLYFLLAGQQTAADDQLCMSHMISAGWVLTDVSSLQTSVNGKDHLVLTCIGQILCSKSAKHTTQFVTYNVVCAGTTLDELSVRWPLLVYCVVIC